MTVAEQKSIEWQKAHRIMAIGGDAFADIVEQMNINPAYVAGYEQAKEDILKIVSQITADLWGAPCNYSPLDEEICLCPNTHCDEICGTPEASDAECWKMYFNLKIAELNKEV